MKFIKNALGHYISEDGRYTIRKIYGSWEVTDTFEKEETYRLTKMVGYRDKILGYKCTLAEAKALCK